MTDKKILAAHVESWFTDAWFKWEDREEGRMEEPMCKTLPGDGGVSDADIAAYDAALDPGSDINRLDQLMYSLPYVGEPGYWIDKQGNRHNMKQMPDNYLRNCINMLRRNGKEHLEVYRELERELENRARPVMDTRRSQQAIQHTNKDAEKLAIEQKWRSSFFKTR